MQRRAYLAAVGAASTGLVGGLAGCLDALGSADADSAEYDVGMSASDFLPAEVTVAVGDAVRWRNTGSRAHTITAYEDAIPNGAAYFASGGFESEDAAREGWQNGEGNVYGGETYEHTFEVPGEHHYFCVPHERNGMVGTVVVE